MRSAQAETKDAGSQASEAMTANTGTQTAASRWPEAQPSEEYAALAQGAAELRRALQAEREGQAPRRASLDATRSDALSSSRHSAC